MKHQLLIANEAQYEAAILDIFQKYPPRFSMVSITLHESGKADGAHTVHQAWPPDSMSASDIAKFVAHRIVEQCRGRSGKVFDSVTIDL